MQAVQNHHNDGYHDYYDDIYGDAFNGHDDCNENHDQYGDAV